MSTKAEELAGLCLSCDGPGLSEIVELFHQYGRLVQEAAAKEAEKPDTRTSAYATFARTQDNIVAAIREMPLP